MKKVYLRGMFTTSFTFRLSSRTSLWNLILGVGIQHGLSFNDPFKQHNSSNSICCLRQLSRLWRMFDLFNTIADDTCSKKRCSIRLAEEPISPLLPNSDWNYSVTYFHFEVKLTIESLFATQMYCSPSPRTLHSPCDAIL